MNTNELADELKWLYENLEVHTSMLEAATMLRQQQAEIETLKAGKIRAYDNGVEDGKKSNTNPAKTLTDEEIWELAEPYGDLAWQDCTLEFARAILLKAQK